MQTPVDELDLLGSGCGFRIKIEALRRSGVHVCFRAEGTAGYSTGARCVVNPETTKDLPGVRDRLKSGLQAWGFGL